MSTWPWPPFVALLLVPGLASGQGHPVGPEFQVNTYTPFSQYSPTLGADPSGNFVVAWTSNEQDGSGRGVFGRRYDSLGAPLGPEFGVNAYVTNHQNVASVAVGPAGEFVIGWYSHGQDGSGYGAFAQRYSSAGAPLGPQFRVNSYTSGFQVGPMATFQPSGDFVMVWGGYGPGSPNRDVFGQRYASSGAPLGPEFRINSYTTQDQMAFFRAVASDASGNFVVVWESYAQDGSNYGIFGQRFAFSGGALGPEFRVNTLTPDAQRYPSIAVDGSGNFVVVWQSSQDGSSFGIFGQRFASSGAPLGPEFRVNTATAGSPAGPSLAADPSGNFVVVWRSLDGSAYGSFGQRYSSSGEPLGPEFRVNTYTTGGNAGAAVTADAAGRFVVAWMSEQDGSFYGVYGQRFSAIVPVELMGLGVE
jgi:hypothetical protein